MESPHTLRIKWFHIIFSSSCVSAFKQVCSRQTTTAPSVCKKKKNRLKIYMELNVHLHAVYFWFGRRAHVRLRRDLQSYSIAWHSLRKYVQKTFNVYHMLLFLSFISTWLLCIFYIFFLQKEFQDLFNKSKKGCKQNALCHSNRDWRVFPKQIPDLWSCHSEYTAGDIKEQTASFS